MEINRQKQGLFEQFNLDSPIALEWTVSNEIDIDQAHYNDPSNWAIHP